MKYYVLYLKASLNDQHQPISKQFDYKWLPTTPGKVNATISFVRRAVSVYLEPSGLYTSFDNQIENDTNWKCTQRKVPISPFDPRTYGGAQTIISYDFFENVLRYAISKDILNTKLNK